MVLKDDFRIIELKEEKLVPISQKAKRQTQDMSSYVVRGLDIVLRCSAQFSKAYDTRNYLIGDVILGEGSGNRRNRCPLEKAKMASLVKLVPVTLQQQCENIPRVYFGILPLML